MGWECGMIQLAQYRPYDAHGLYNHAIGDIFTRTIREAQNVDPFRPLGE